MLSLIRKYLWVLHLLLIGVCTYFFAQTASNYISTLLHVGDVINVKASKSKAGGARQKSKNISAYAFIAERDIFNSAALLPGAEEEIVEEKREEEPQLKTAVKTSLPIKLLGTLVVGSGMDRRSSATIEGGKPTSKATVYFIDGEETFGPGVKVVQILPRRVEFINGKRLEFVDMGDSGGLSIFRPPEEVHQGGSSKKSKSAKSSGKKPAKSSGIAEEEGKIVIDQSEVDNALTNLDKLYTEIRIVPNFKNGKSAGMKVLSIKPGSLFSKLGLKRGDVLEQINGLELDIKSGMMLFGQLKDAKSLNIDLTRKGQKKSIQYEIR